MSILDDMLMAYADGEFDAPEFNVERAAVAAALAAEPTLARVVEQHRALRSRLGALHAEVLDEPVPEKLLAAIRAAPAAPRSPEVASLEQARAGKSAARRTMRPWYALAASLVAGVIAVYVAYTLPSGPLSVSDGQLIARGSLDQALSHQLTSEQSQTAAVRIGLSFRGRSDRYCRTFILQQRERLGGLACRRGENWRIETLAQINAGAGGDSGFRQAGSDMPAAVSAAVQEQIAGDALSPDGEIRARQNRWQ